MKLIIQMNIKTNNQMIVDDHSGFPVDMEDRGDTIMWPRPPPPEP